MMSARYPGRWACCSFITREVMPLEAELLRRERRHEPGLTRDELKELQLKAKRFGYWGLSTPEEYGGMDLPAVSQSLVWTEIGRYLQQWIGRDDRVLAIIGAHARWIEWRA